MDISNILTKPAHVALKLTGWGFAAYAVGRTIQYGGLGLSYLDDHYVQSVALKLLGDGIAWSGKNLEDGGWFVGTFLYSGAKWCYDHPVEILSHAKSIMQSTWVKEGGAGLLWVGSKAKDGVCAASSILWNDVGAPFLSSSWENAAPIGTFVWENGTSGIWNGGKWAAWGTSKALFSALQAVGAIGEFGNSKL